MGNKLIVSPSYQADYEYCKLLYHRKHNLLLDFPEQPARAKDGQPLLGSLIHVTHAAYDTNEDYAAAVKAALRALRASIHYNIKYAPLVDQVERDALRIFRGGSVKDGRGKETRWISYPEWRTGLLGQDHDGRAGAPVVAHVVDVEKRLWVDVGPVVLAPKLDAVVCAQNVFGRGEETWWVEEIKSTGRDDSNWRWRWEMDGQTTCQIIAAEEHYDRAFEGVLINQVVVTRRKSVDARDDILQPLNKVVRYDARWVSKKPEVRALYMAYLEDLAKDFEARSARGEWTATGMLNRHCDLCSHRPVCSGRMPTAALKPVPKDEITVEFERRRKASIPKESEKTTEGRKRRARKKTLLD